MCVQNPAEQNWALQGDTSFLLRSRGESTDQKYIVYMQMLPSVAGLQIGTNQLLVTQEMKKTPDIVASWEQEGETLFNSYWKKIVATAVMHLCPGGVVMRGGLK